MLGVAGLVVVAAVAGLAWMRGSLLSVPVREHCTATALGVTTDLDPEQAGNAAIIAAVAVQRGLPARAATIGIATARQESKLRNIDYGDRDSIGLFQQRPSQGWGTVEQIMDPLYATNAFYDVLVKVEGYQSLPITAAAQKVQRSAFPSAYGDHESQARSFASALSGYSEGALTCVLKPVGDAAVQTAGKDGFTPRAAAVAKAAKAEAGRTAVPVPATSDAPAGTSLAFTMTGKDATRLGWALAQWAVARADGLEIVAVQTAGKQWRRDEVDSGWTALDDPSTVPAGKVVVRMAPGTA